MGVFGKLKGNLKFGRKRGDRWETQKNERKFVEQKQSCPACHLHIGEEELKQNYFVCPGCNHHFQITVSERLASISDPGSFQEFAGQMQPLDPLEFPGYKEKVSAAKEKTGLNDSVVIGECTVNQRRALLGIMSFDFMGGSMGSVVGEKITRLMIRGSEVKTPVVIFTSSGGARMQEGIFSLMQMAKTSHAAALLKKQRVPLFIVLTHPTTGGVTASFAMLGNINIAEPGALIGFAGPRVIESTIKQKLPEGFQKSEFQLSKGFVDMVVDRREIKKTITFLIDTHKEGAK